ncbi:MAG: FctA domain-containing protein, partial [Eubacteriales bacterium]
TFENYPSGVQNPVFTYTLKETTEGAEYTDTATTAGAGSYAFKTIEYTETGTHTYVVTEENSEHKNVVYDTTAYEVTVDVTDNAKGQLVAKVSATKNGKPYGNITSAGTGLDFTNKYIPEKASVYITGNKTLTNGTMKAGQFYFDLYDAAGQKIDTATNDESGAFSFARLEFGQEDIGKTFNYTVREQHAGEVIDGIRYADDEIPVSVTVSAGDGGSIIAAASGSADFTNTQLASLTVNKTWNDNDNADGNRPDSVHVSILKDGEVVRQGDLSETTGWSMTFEGLEPGESYTVEESFDSEYYKAEQNDITVDLNGTDNEVTLVNDYIHPTVDIVANKVLVGGKLQSGQFTFQLYRNSDPNTVVATRVNDASGQIVFNDIEYDEAGYTVREVTGTDTHITYDTGAVTYDADGNVTGSHTEFTNTERPIVLRVQKRSKTAPYDPLEGATYGLYQVVEGGNDILVESEVSDENGYMYYSNIQPGVIYYFKEIAAPTGHEVDPYAGQKFQIKYTNDGQIAVYDVDGNPTTLGDITSQNSNELLVQHTDAKSTIDTTSALSYSDDTIVAAAKAVNGAFDEGTTLKVTQLTGSAAKSAAAAVEDATGEIKNNVAYYDVQFIDKDGKEVEPKAGDVTVTIQYKDSLSLPEGTDASALKLVHITDGNAVEAVAGSIAAGNGKLLEAKITSDSFSTFGVVEPGKSNTLGSNYLVTAAGVSDQVSELNISKLDTAGKYVKGARLQIIEKATGKVVAEWNTSDGPMSFARWFDGAGTEPMNVDTYYILHEVSAPDGYQLADDIMFIINKYDSSITVYKYDDAGNLVADQEAVDQWVSDTTLSMVDVPVEYRNKVRYVQKTIHNEKTIQGDNKVVEVTSVRAVKTGDTTPIALFVIMLAAAAVVLMVLAYRKNKQDNQ